MIVPRGRIVAIVAASYAGTCRHKHAAAACSIALHFHRAPATVRVIGKKGNVRRRRMDWQARVEELSDPEFTARYRLNKKGFRMLANRLRPKLEPKTRRSNPLSVELQLASTLRYLAGGHHLDLADQIGCSRKTFHTMAAKVVRAIVKVLPKVTFPFGDSVGHLSIRRFGSAPADQRRLRELQQRQVSRHGRMRGRAAGPHQEAAQERHALLLSERCVANKPPVYFAHH